jgi:hypothetical protein
MAVSGSKDFAITRADIIGAALRKIGVFDEADDVSGEATTTASLALNMLVKEWVADGADIFLRTESTLFLQPDTNTYTLSTDHITDSYVETTLSAAEASGQTVISVTSSTGMTAADNVGIKMDDNTIHWTTIASVDSSTQITIDTATDDDAASGNKVYAYTTKSDRPQKILYAFRSDINGFDTEITIIGENEYRSQSNKTSDGPPVEIWYNPQGNQTTGKLHVWPDNGGKNWDKIVLIAQHLADDFDIGSNNPDFPIEWSNALTWGLAAEIGSEYGLPPQEISYLEAKARYKLDKMLDYDTENASVIFALERQR